MTVRYFGVVVSAFFVFVYLLTYPSLLIRSAFCKQLFWYVFVLAVAGMCWELLVLWWLLTVCFCVIGCVGSFKIRSTTLTHWWSRKVAIGSIFYTSNALADVIPIMLKNLCFCFSIFYFAWVLADPKSGADIDCVVSVMLR